MEISRLLDWRRVVLRVEHRIVGLSWVEQSWFKFVYSCDIAKRAAHPAEFWVDYLFFTGSSSNCVGNVGGLRRNLPVCFMCRRTLLSNMFWFANLI